MPIQCNFNVRQKWSVFAWRLPIWAIGAILVLAVCAGLAFLRSSAPLHRAPRSLQLSSQLRLAPLFELPRIGKGKVRLQDLQGQVVIIHFWASWCPPCLDEIPQWVELGTYFKGKRLRLVAISEDQTESEALAVLPTQRLPDNIFSLLDRQGQTSERYGTFQYPETYLLTPRLEIAMKWVGPQDWSSEVIRKQIESLLP